MNRIINITRRTKDNKTTNTNVHTLPRRGSYPGETDVIPSIYLRLRIKNKPAS